MTIETTTRRRAKQLDQASLLVAYLRVGATIRSDRSFIIRREGAKACPLLARNRACRDAEMKPAPARQNRHEQVTPGAPESHEKGKVMRKKTPYSFGTISELMEMDGRGTTTAPSVLGPRRSLGSISISGVRRRRYGI